MVGGRGDFLKRTSWNRWVGGAVEVGVRGLTWKEKEKGPGESARERESRKGQKQSEERRGSKIAHRSKNREKAYKEWGSKGAVGGL